MSDGVESPPVAVGRTPSAPMREIEHEVESKPVADRPTDHGAVPPRLEGVPPGPAAEVATGRRSAAELWEAARWILTAHLRLGRCDRVGRRTRLRGRPCVSNDGSIVIGDRAVLLSHAVPIELQTVHGGAIEIGDETLINYGSIVVAYERVQIGSRCLIGKHVIIMDNNQHDFVHRDRPGPSKPVVIEDDAWLGDRAIVLPGVTVGHGAVVGAGSVVTKDIPAMCVAVGNPARVVRSLA